MHKLKFGMNRIFSLISLICLSHLSLGQEAESVRTIRFMVYSESGASPVADESGNSDDTTPRVQFTYFESGQARRVDEPAYRFQGPYTVQIIDNVLLLYKTSVVNLDEVQQSDILARIQVPDDWSELLLYSRRTQDQSFAQFFLLSDLAVLGERKQTFCLNMTDKDIVVNIGEQRFDLRPFDKGEVELGQFENNQAKIKVAAQWEDEWNLVLSTTRRLQTTNTNLLLFKGLVHNPRAMSLKVVRVPRLSMED